MIIKVFANFRSIVGASQITYPVPDPQPVKNVLNALAEKYGKDMKDILFTDGRISKDLMLSLNDQVIEKDPERLLHDSDQLLLLLPLKIILRKLLMR